jgi:hypothetical protein
MAVRLALFLDDAVDIFVALAFGGDLRTREFSRLAQPVVGFVRLGPLRHGSNPFVPIIARGRVNYYSTTLSCRQTAFEISQLSLHLALSREITLNAHG